MSLRRVDTGPELVEVESVASDWSESPHQPALSEETRLHLRSGHGTVFVSDSPRGIASITTTKRAAIGMVEVAVPGDVSASDFWDRAEPDVKSEAVRKGYRALELLTWDAELRGEMEDRGWMRVRAVNRGKRTSSPIPPQGDGGLVHVFQGELDIDGLLEVNNLAFEGHPQAGNWDHPGLEALFEEPWFDPAGLFVTRDDLMVTGFCWTKVYPDRIGEIYLLAVRPGHAGKGLGRALVITGIEYLTTGRGCEESVVYWDPSNAAAANLYQSIGFGVDRVGEVFRHRM
ncbi:MAG: GNAT family N-acetyltransferase [Acidimicrobiia bacterium]